MSVPNETIWKLAMEASLMPEEKLAKLKKSNEQLFIGIPKEITLQETRTPLTPEDVGLLVNNGFEILIESKAGEKSKFLDKDYSEAGAQIVYDTNKIYQADLVLKIEPPSLEEIEMMKPGLTIISTLQLSVQPKNFLQLLMKKKITVLAWDYIKDSSNCFPVIRTMGEIAGKTSVLIASEILSSKENGTGLMLGGVSGVPPVEVVIIGAGTVGLNAAKAATGLGAIVKVFDQSVSRLRRFQDAVGQNIYTSVIHPNQLALALETADVAIGALRPKNGRTPCVVNEQMISRMKYGSVIIDVSIDQGGVFETSNITTHQNPTFSKYGVTHYCVPNIASRVAKTASQAFSNIITPFLLEMSDHGGVKEYIKHNAGFRYGIYVYNGILTSESLGKYFNLPYKDLELILMTI